MNSVSNYVLSEVRAEAVVELLTVKKILSVIGVWRERAKMRKQLEHLPDYRLEDMGIDAKEAAEEAGKPFWQE